MQENGQSALISSSEDDEWNPPGGRGHAELRGLLESGHCESIFQFFALNRMPFPEMHTGKGHQGL